MKKQNTPLYSTLLGLVGVGLLVMTGCDTTAPSIHEAEVVVESYQVANEPLSHVRLARSVALNGRYDPDAQGITNASVRVYLLGGDESIEKTYTFAHNAGRPGVYLPNSTDRVLPRRTYALEVNFPDRSETVSARTIVPDAFDIVGGSSDSVQYQGAEQFSLDVTQSHVPGRQTVYIFSVESLDPVVENLVPLYLDLIVDDEGNINEGDLEDVRIITSNLVNEGNYEVTEAGTIQIRLPWLAVAFYNDNRLKVSAIDNNVYDFTRSLVVQQGGGLAPGEIPNVLDHVDGGTGVFGSMAQVETGFFVGR